MTWNRYPRYKDSVIGWLGEVPEHWEVRRLKHSTDLINTKIDGAESDLPYTGMEHIESWTGKRISTNKDTMSESQTNLYSRSDVLFGKLRPYLAKAHAPDIEGICSSEFLVLRPKAVEQKFLLNYVLNPDFIAMVDSSTYGAKMPRANWDFVGNLPTLIPPLDEQRTIASFLDRETERIDVLIAKKERQIELLQEKRAALISHAVTKGLNPDAKMKDPGIEWLGEIPEHWKIVKLGFKASVKARLGWKGLKAEEYVDEGFIFLSTPNIKKEAIDFVNVNHIRSERFYESPEIILQNGDVLIAKDGSTLGITNVVKELPAPATVNSSIAVIRPNLEVHSIFLYYLLLSDYTQNIIQKMKAGQGVPHLFQADIRKFWLWLPSFEEQNAIAAFLDVETVQIDVLIRKVEESTTKLHEYRTALISAAVTGKIDVRKEVA
ncbi:MAG TPA: restriction endonuclease subunit S [Syntrophales bacterium]|nr:restriction endonuclease subunit S [Syntrophales bacterium]